ncbi:MAG: tyrosine-type recombinase/integrase [Lachnospiraceae bacterium]|jgi:site-specific recombinase XerD|nr:tyrosine-type recombinase/integrase [Lachnospiraceae bacterium]
MGQFLITEELLLQYQQYLYEEEKTTATIKKYISDLRKLSEYASGQEITKQLMVGYKENLRKRYKLTSINSFLVAANRFFEYAGWYGLRVKTFRIQKEVFVPESRDLSKTEYRKMVKMALKKGKKRLAMMLQTICATGIRISELASFTAESVVKGVVEIYCKGKQRVILLSKKLQKKLLSYLKENHIVSGTVFCTSGGKAVDRSNIWKEMKLLSEEAGIPGGKAYPHNLRHLFAKEFYGAEKDIAKLADVLGHSSIETTRIYVKTTSEEHRKQLDQMKLVI